MFGFGGSRGHDTYFWRNKYRVPGRESRNPGAYSDEVTPVPIPNTAVKLVRADGSPCASVCESKSAPGFLLFFISPGDRIQQGK